MSKVKGYVLFEGSSSIDGKPVVAIATLKTSNIKTGNMVQTWILRSDVTPTEAVKTGADESVCGDCKQRHFKKGACYVLPFTAPLSIYKTYKKGGYSNDWNSETFKGLNVRLGAYGDPTAVPFTIWEQVTKLARTTTGYTHRWQNKKKTIFSTLCMASVENVNEKKQAERLGYRTFRIVTSEKDMIQGEKKCFNETHNLTCEQCGACSGTRKASRRNFVVVVHGQKAKRFNEQTQK